MPIKKNYLTMLGINSLIADTAMKIFLSYTSHLYFDIYRIKLHCDAVVVVAWLIGTETAEEIFLI